MMQSPVTNPLLRSCLLVIFTLISFSVAYSQESQTEKELTEAINNAKNGKFEQAIPVLKKYAEIKGFDDYKTLDINVYLNWCYLATKNEALDVEKVNALTDAYLEKYGISKTDSLKSVEEMKLLYIAGIINSNHRKNEKSVSYLLPIKQHYDEKRLVGNPFYSYILYALTLGYYNLSDYKPAIETGQIAWKVNFDLFGERNNESLELLDLLYLSFKRINKPKKSFEYIQREVDIGREFWGEKNPNYLLCLNNLALAYSDLGDNHKALEINLKVIELDKEVLGEKHQGYLLSLNNLGSIYSDMGDHIKAIRIYQELVNLSLEILDVNSPNYFTYMNNLALEFSYLLNSAK